MSPTSGSAISVSRRISPGAFIPISITACVSSPASPRSVSGTPIRLFRLPCVLRTRSARRAVRGWRRASPWWSSCRSSPVTARTHGATTAPEVGGEVLERAQRVADLEHARHRCPTAARGARDDEPRSARGDRGSRESVRVVMLARERHEELARRRAWRVSVAIPRERLAAAAPRDRWRRSRAATSASSHDQGARCVVAAAVVTNGPPRLGADPTRKPRPREHATRDRAIVERTLLGADDLVVLVSACRR